MVGPRQHGAPADRLDRRDDPSIVGRHQHRPDVGFDGAPPDVDDHRLAVDVGERLAGQARRGHAGGDEDDGFGHGRVRFARGQKKPAAPRLYVLPSPAQSG